MSGSPAPRPTTTSPRPTAAPRSSPDVEERVFWSERFTTFEDLRVAVREFAATSSEHWVLERHGHRTPTEARQELLTRMLPLIRVFTQAFGAPGRGQGRLKLAAPSIARSG